MTERVNEEIYDKSQKSERPSKGFIELNKSADQMEHHDVKPDIQLKDSAEKGKEI